MKRGHISLVSPHSAAIFARLVAFFVAASSALVIPAMFVAAGAGRVTVQAALAASVGAFAIILLASLVVRSFDPLRG